MAQSYLEHGMAATPATFSLFVRRLPPDWAFFLAAGLEDVLDHLESFYLRTGRADRPGRHRAVPRRVFELARRTALHQLRARPSRMRSFTAFANCRHSVVSAVIRSWFWIEFRTALLDLWTAVVRWQKLPESGSRRSR
jgi:nicotinic acid phosphoribosyltransferase